MGFEKISLEPIEKDEKEQPDSAERSAEEREVDEHPEAATDKEMLEKLPDLSDVEVPIETGSLGKRIEKMEEERRLGAEKEEAERREAEAAEKESQQAEYEGELTELLAGEERDFMENENYPRIVEAAVERIIQAGGRTKKLVGEEQVAIQDPVLDGCVTAMVENPILGANVVAAVERFALDTAINFERGGVTLYNPEDPSRRGRQELAVLPGLFQGRDPEAAQQLRELITETVEEVERDRREATTQAPGDGEAFFQAGESLPPIRKMGSVELSRRRGLALDHQDVISVAELAGTVSRGVREVLAPPLSRGGPEDEASRQRYEALAASAMLLREYAEGRTAVEVGRGKFLFDTESARRPLSLRDQEELERLKRVRSATDIARKLETL